MVIEELKDSRGAEVNSQVQSYKYIPELIK